MSQDPLLGRLLGGFLVESLIGRGGMSRVYAAQQISLGRRVALKVVSAELAADEEFRARFLRESRIASSIDHPNILPVYDAGEQDGLLFMAMRFVEGSDLSARIAAGRPMSAERALHYMSQAAAALDAAHAIGLIHRDVKPANMLLAAEHLYLADFGVAKVASTRSDFTRTGMFVGTIDYASPEQIRNEDLDGRADLYALGCVLFQCLSGRVPYDRPSEYGVMQAHMTEAVPSLHSLRPDLPIGIDEVISVALAKDRDARYRSGRHLVNALRLAVSGANAGPVRSTGARPTVTAPAPGARKLPILVQPTIATNPTRTSGRAKGAVALGGVTAILIAGLMVMRGAVGAVATASSTPEVTAQTTVRVSPPTGEIIIATNFPVSGADRASGRAPEAGAQYAIAQVGTIKGFKITVKSYDDAVNGIHDPQQGAKNFADMVSNRAILAVVGPFNSSVTRATLPIANRAGLAMISPSNTDECLTQTFAYCRPTPAELRPSGGNNYFRISANDTFQGPAMADFAVDRLGILRAATFSDSEVFGSMTADGFCSRLLARGGQCVVRQDFDMRATTDFTSFLSRARAAGAQAVYAGATSSTKGCVVRAQMKASFTVNTPFLGNDGIGDSQCMADARDMGSNMYFTNAAGDASQDPANSELIRSFQRAFPNQDDYGAYTFPSYDCARIVLDAIARAIDRASGSMPSRQQVVSALAETRDLKLSTGTFGFDVNGDPVAPTMAFYHSISGVWQFSAQLAVHR